jgi:hypothetical protein
MKRWDTADHVFFTRELEKVSSKIFDITKIDVKGLQFVAPISDDIRPEDERYTVRQREYVGAAKRMFQGSDERLPAANVKYTEGSVGFASYGDSYFYTIDEIRAAQRVGRPLKTDRAEAAKTVLERQLDTIVSLGDSDAGLSGLTNLTGTSTVTVDAGASTKKGWQTKTGEEMYNDLVAMCREVRTVSGDKRSVKRILLPLEAYDIADSKRFNSFESRSVLEVFQGRRGVEVLSWERLDGIGTGRAIAYDPNPELVGLLLPVPFEQMEPERRGFTWYIECRNKTGGVIAREPKTIVYADDLLNEA